MSVPSFRIRALFTPRSSQRPTVADPKIIDFQAGKAAAQAAGKASASSLRGTGIASIMRSDLVEQASEIIPDPPLLINMVSRRVKQLNMGRSPLVQVEPRMGMADVALLEIIEGKVALDDGEEEAEAPAPKKKAAAKKAAAKK